MSKAITLFVGLDVHKDSTAIGVAEAGRESPQFIGTVGSDLARLLKALKSLGNPEMMLVVYEAGPCGYGLTRQLRSRGYACEVVAAGKMARQGTHQDRSTRCACVGPLGALGRSGESDRAR